MLALGNFLFQLFQVPWQIIEHGRGILFEIMPGSSFSCSRL